MSMDQGKVKQRGIILISTFSDEQSVIDLSNILINEKRLCACINYTTIKSIYIWNSVLQHDNELIAFFKTTEDLVDDLKTEIKRNHPYDVPEIVVIKMSDISDEYMDWMYKVTHIEKNNGFS
jgi:periplasmic divalent cation tolerance protein